MIRLWPAGSLRSSVRLPLTLLAAAICALALAPTAFAAPDITLDKQAPARVLFGDDSPVTLHVANPAGQPYGYNLSLRDVLPAGISYVPGSASVEPRVIQNAPAAGQTTLIFDNVSDLSPGSSYDLTYQVRHDPAEYSIGESYTNQAGAYINDDPHFVPDFAPDGTPGGDITGSATDSASTQISAIEIEKDEPSPEGELLRGVHDHQTVYTLTVRNNGIEPTTGLTVEDWLPAGLEYLGCGAGDNTTDAPTNPGSDEEYAGSGPINPGNAPAAPDCVEPVTVETLLTDPDGAGPLPTGVYTHVVWNGLGDLAADGELRLQYVAAVPLRENTMTWTSPFGAPTPVSLGQGSNLDNNSGPETQDEQALTNYSTVAGDYDGTLAVSDDDALTRTAEDLRVLKSVDNGDDQPGADQHLVAERRHLRVPLRGRRARRRHGSQRPLPARAGQLRGRLEPGRRVRARPAPIRAPSTPRSPRRPTGRTRSTGTRPPCQSWRACSPRRSSRSRSRRARAATTSRASSTPARCWRTTRGRTRSRSPARTSASAHRQTPTAPALEPRSTATSRTAPTTSTARRPVSSPVAS